MKQIRNWVPYLVAIAAAAAIVLMTVSFQIGTYGTGTKLLTQFLSDGFFTSAVLLLGCGLLMFIAEAGNFYGIQYLGYMVLCLFSIRKDRLENRKDYFTYCTEKKAKQKKQGKSSLKWALLFVGLACLILSIIFAILFYH